MRLLATREIAAVGGKFTGSCTRSVAGPTVTVGRTQLGPGPFPAQRGEAGTHAKPRQEMT